MFDKVDAQYNFTACEKEVREFWKENHVFEKSVKKNEGKPEFTFYDGPPTANGVPHVGHILTRSIKDLIPRYRTMKGYHVERKAGWDTHGLPVELEVEKELGFSGKADIEKYGIVPFIDKCRKSVWKYKDLWEDMSERIGFWADFENPYITYDNKYIESVWWAFKQLDAKELLYHGHKIVPYCPRCGTALSSHEVAQGYKNIKTRSAYVRFRLRDEADTCFLAWTTTPWTLPSNVALCVNPDAEYVKIKTEDGCYILAKALVGGLFEEGKYEVVAEYIGKDLEYTKYEPLFPYVKDKYYDKAWFVTCDGYVTLDSGTGIVHIAPAFGEDDSKVGKKYKLPFVQLADERGCFPEAATEYAGRFVMDCDPDIITRLSNEGSLFKVQTIEHQYPYCWRCDSPLLYYGKPSWFIAMSTLRDELTADNASVNWLPETYRDGRMGNFVSNVIDWAISRDRYWGTPLPVWVCDKCEKHHVIGSVEELSKLTGAPADIDLHKPSVDPLTFECECGGTMHRVPEVIDCWFDSGAMPFAQQHYPFENKDLFEKQFPADFISEGSDQTRGWFYSLQAISTAIFGKSPYKNCVALGLVNDKDGIKMSKHKGNVVDPWEVMDKHGADAIRWYFYVSSAPWISTNFDGDAINEHQRRFMGTMWNTFHFYNLYSGIDNFNPNSYKLADCKLTMMDKWILGLLNSVIKKVDTELEGYHITEAARELVSFVDLMSNWYVRRCRRRFWMSELTEDKIAAYMTLYTVLDSLIRLAAPFVPFATETIYQSLVRKNNPDAPISIHMCDFPVCDESYIDEALERDMKLVYDSVGIARNARNLANLKIRQPLSRLLVCVEGEDAHFNEEMLSIIAEELNVEKAEQVSSTKGFISHSIKPQLKTLGPKYGKVLNAIREYFATVDGDSVIDDIEANGSHKTNLGGTDVEFTMDDLLISTGYKEGFMSAADRNITVILDTVLTPELIQKGYAREFVSKVQNMRKSSGFEVMDRIVITYASDDEFEQLLAPSVEAVSKELLADEIVRADSVEGEELDINGKNVVITVRKVQK